MNGKEAVELLLAKDIDVAREKSESINQYNEERRELDKKITDEANAIIEAIPNIEEKKPLSSITPDGTKGLSELWLPASRKNITVLLWF